MQFTITDLCLSSDADYDRLRRRTDACSRLGRSYEIPCTLPDTCTPANAWIGFCRTGEQYMLYVRPKIRYSGTNRRAAEFFSTDIHPFSNFSALMKHFRQLGQEFAAPQMTMQPSPLFHQITSTLGQHVLGQKDAVEAVAFRLHNHICKSKPSRPLSLVLYGPTGVGKSELAKSIAPVLQTIQRQQQWHSVWTELNTFTQPHSVSRLIGSPPGYIGYDDPPVLEHVRQNSHTVFIFDELDKAHPEVLKIFMSILDEGRCTARRTDELGQRELDFRDCIFVFTSNMDLSAAPRQPLGFTHESPSPGVPLSPSDSMIQRLLICDENARRAMIRFGIPPEIACRFTGLIGFRPLDESARLQITVKQISALGREFGLNIVSVSPGLAAALTPCNAVSIRSTPAVLEGTLTAVFAEHIIRSNVKNVHLSGTLDAVTLTSAEHFVNVS